MIERAAIVAWREFVKTVWSRSFLFLVFFPVVIVVVPAGITTAAIGAATVADSFEDADGDAVPVLWVIDATRSLELAETAEGDGTEFDVRLAGARSLEALRKELAEDADVVIADVRADALEPGSEAYEVRYSAGMSHHARRLEYVVHQWILGARLREAGMDEQQVMDLWEIDGEVSRLEQAERGENIAAVVVEYFPAGVVFVLYLVGTMGGRGLLSSTLEEKSSRVVELLMGAVSPTELMLGKLMGHVAATSVLAASWLSPVVVMLAVTASVVLVQPLQLFYICCFFLVGFMVISSILGAVGAAVNDIREAQTLAQPVVWCVMLMIGPAFLAIADPDSNAALMFSLAPPFNTFSMVARVASESQPPHWQIWLSLVISVATAGLLVLASARIYRMGLLLQGPPPNFPTFVRWMLRP